MPCSRRISKGGRQNPSRIRASLLQVVGQEQAGADRAAIKVKALVIGGEENGPNFPALAKRSADPIRRPQLHLIPDVCHNSHI